MRVRTFAVWALLGATASIGAALLIPVPHARGESHDGPTVAPLPASETETDASRFVDGKTLVLDGRLGHGAIASSRSGSETFVLATITGGEASSDVPSAPPPVHLAIVVDRSGSMAGKKMDSAIAAAVGAVERMHDGDRATVIAFDTAAKVLVPPTSLDAGTRPAVEASIRAMHVGGDTCISCALTSATAELDASPGPPGEVKRVLLISDGEATTGIRDAVGLRTLAARARDRGITVSTIGVDLTFDEKVMAGIAQESNGRHWFVPDASALSRVFEEELGALETAIASEAELAITPARGVIVEEVLDRAFRREGGRVRIPLGAFDAREEKTVLLRVRVPAGVEGVEPVADLELSYRDVATRAEARCKGSLGLDVRGDGSEQKDLDPFVAARLERSRTSHALTKANELFERGHAEAARDEIARRQRELATAAAPAEASAAALPPRAKAFARPLGGDFKEQEAALNAAQSGLAGAATTTPRAGRAGPAAPSPSPQTQQALKTNQAHAVDLAF
jgi:Ca-activated chloride channel family protein